MEGMKISPPVGTVREAVIWRLSQITDGEVWHFCLRVLVLVAASIILLSVSDINVWKFFQTCNNSKVTFFHVHYGFYVVCDSRMDGYVGEQWLQNLPPWYCFQRIAGPILKFNLPQKQKSCNEPYILIGKQSIPSKCNKP